MKLPANKQKKRGGKRSTSWPKGVSGNPAGAPKRGESWAEIIKQVGELTSEEAALRASRLWATTFRRQPKGVTLKELVVLNAYVALLDTSSASLLNALMDRSDGKVPDRSQVEGKLTVVGLTDMLEKVFGSSSS